MEGRCSSCVNPFGFNFCSLRRPLSSREGCRRRDSRNLTAKGVPQKGLTKS
ncbi:hypothetical protein M758_4G031300 [Ceratodon purpureus]|nr:hypothetical protein M758_4G031300 [Ceratodon purpureus]